jgi:hypothetical protein
VFQEAFHVARANPLAALAAKGASWLLAVQGADAGVLSDQIRAVAKTDVFAEQKARMGLFIRTVGITRTTTKIGMANLVYNIKRLLFLQRIAVE